LASRPPPLSSVSSTGDTQKTEKERELADDREGEGSGRGAKSYDRKKSGPLQIIQYSLVLPIDCMYKKLTVHNAMDIAKSKILNNKAVVVLIYFGMRQHR
jgi:hypothetical protein